MRIFIFLLTLVLTSAAANAQQSFEGLLVYEQEMAGAKTRVEVWVRPKEVHLVRKEATELHYWLNAQGELTAWVAGKTLVNKTVLNQPELPTAKAGTQKRVIAGYQATQFELTFADGSKIVGWYAPAVNFNHNAFILPIQGNWWGRLPANGLLLEWQYTNAKGGEPMKGKLIDVQAGAQSAHAFELPAGARLVD